MKTIFFSVLVAMSFSVAAEEVDCSRPLESMYGPEQKFCVQTQAKFSHDRINATYKKLMSKLSRERKDVVRNFQRSWIKAREDICHDAGEEVGTAGIGSAYEVAYQLCIIETNEERRLFLADILKGIESGRY